MDGRRRSNHRAAKDLAYRLMTETDSQDRNPRGGLLDQLEANARVVGRAGAGRQHNGVRLARQRVHNADFVIAKDGYLRPQPAK